MAEKFQVILPEDMIQAIRRETDSVASPEINTARRIRYMLARQLGIDSGRAYAMLIGNLPGGGRKPGKSAAT